jgi:hypothetical protein
LERDPEGRNEAELVAAVLAEAGLLADQPCVRPATLNAETPLIEVKLT